MTRITMAVLLAVILPTAAAARDPGARHDEAEDRAALQDDLRDSKRAEQLLNDFDRAAAARSLQLISIEKRIMKAFDRELKEASREIAQAGDEARRSEEEVRRDRHDRGDRVAAAKDRRDYAEKVQYRDRIQGLRNDWRQTYRDHKPAAMQRKHNILVALVDLSRREIRSDMDELRENRDERRDERGDRHDRFGDGREEGRDRGELRDDLRDARYAEDLLRAFDRAASERNWNAIDDIERRVMGALRAEVAEASRETGDAARQAQRAEWRRGRHAATDEKREFIEQARYRERVVSLSNEWQRLMAVRERPHLDRKHQMLVELVQLSRYEIRSDVDELHDRH